MIDDLTIAAALRYIRDHACTGIRVVDLVRETGLSQSVLERRFRAIPGRSPKAELLRVQIQRARELLAKSDMQIKEVAHKALSFGNFCRLDKTEL